MSCWLPYLFYYVCHVSALWHPWYYHCAIFGLFCAEDIVFQTLFSVDCHHTFIASTTAALDDTIVLLPS